MRLQYEFHMDLDFDHIDYIWSYDKIKSYWFDFGSMIHIDMDFQYEDAYWKILFGSFSPEIGHIF